ncbi:MAG: DUF4238 domain-containing protein [Acidimicrobiaceae bacterium]|nr:DUF4238 domain-containing protein [Acidimicrobiaceae bacterium]
MTEPKRHHFVPRFYLRRFADEDDRVFVRSRNGRSFVTSTGNVMVRSGLYRIPSQLRTAEATLSKYEESAHRALERIGRGGFPSVGTEERPVLALFVALQFARHFDYLTAFELRYDIEEIAGSLPASLTMMRQYLSELYGFEPRDHEVQAAADFINGYFNMWPNETIEDIQEFRIQTMFEMALNTIAPMLEDMSWSLEVSKQPHLITSDRPAVLWHPSADQDYYQGIGIADAQEIWFVLDPFRMLVLRHSGAEKTRRVGPERVEFVNAHVARHCTRDIVAGQSAKAQLGTVCLASRRPTVRFGRGEIHDQYGVATGEEVIHVWRPIRDVPDDITDPYQP